MCAIHRAGGSAPMNQAHSMEGFADDNGGWGYFEEEEHEHEEEEPQHHEERAQQQKERAEWFEETGQLPEMAITGQGAPLQSELLAQVPERDRPHQPEPTGTAKLVAMSQSSTQKRNYVRHIDRSRRVQPEPALQMQPQRHVPQPTAPDDMPSILTPPPSNPAQPQPGADPAAPHASSPWSLGNPPNEESYDEDGNPIANIPSSAFDVEHGRDPYNALKNLKAPKKQLTKPPKIWPNQTQPDPDSLPHYIHAVEPPPKPAPRKPQPAVRFLSTSPRRAQTAAPPPQHAMDVDVESLDETIGGPGRFLLVDDSFFDNMSAAPPAPAPQKPKRHAPKIDLEQALGVADLEAMVSESDLLDIGLVGQDAMSDTMFGGDADALLQQAEAELSPGGWFEDVNGEYNGPHDLQMNPLPSNYYEQNQQINQIMQQAALPHGATPAYNTQTHQPEPMDPFSPDALSLDLMPLGSQTSEEDNLDSTMMGDIGDLEELYGMDDWDEKD